MHYIEVLKRISSCIAQSDLFVSEYPPMSFTKNATFIVRQMIWCAVSVR